MNESAQREVPHVGIFWVAQTSNGEARLLTASCPLDQAEPYGDCLTYGPGHHETWDHLRRDRTVDPALRTLVRSYEYEDWPRVLYADRKLLTPATIAHEGEARAAAFVSRHPGKHRSGAKRQPFARNLYARTEAASPCIPFLQKLLRLLYPKLRSSSGRIWLGG